MPSDEEKTAADAALPGFVAQLSIREEAYAVGQCIEGELAVELSQETECEGLAVALVGFETVRLKSLGTVQTDATFVVQQAVILPHTMTTLPAGKHTYPISLHIHDVKLPATGDMVAKPGWSSQFSYAITYEVRVLLHMKGSEIPAIVIRKPLVMTKCDAKPPLRASSESTSRCVRVCGFSPGVCKARATLDADAIDNSIGIVPVKISIDNDSRHHVTAITLRLNAMLDVNIPAKGNTKSIQKLITRRILNKKSNIIVKPKSMNDKIALQLSMDDVYAYIKKTGMELQKPLLPSSKLKIGNVRYSVEVIVAIGRLCSRTMKIELPIDLLCLTKPITELASAPLDESEPKAQVGETVDSGNANAHRRPDDAENDPKEEPEPDYSAEQKNGDQAKTDAHKADADRHESSPDDDVDLKVATVEEASPTD